jgi:glycyl-tRNA synthetase alpha chain
VTYGDVFLQSEQEYSRYNFEIADTAMLLKHFEDAEKECEAILKSRRAGRARCTAQMRAAGLRPVHQGEPCLQPARCAWRDLGHRAPGLYPRVRNLSRQCGEAFLQTDAGGANYRPAAEAAE